MADIFISYKREDRPVAERLSMSLEQFGFSVWWDFDLLSGDPFRQVIRAVIDQCSAAVVLWSERATASDFVMDEATYAKSKGKLCPIMIEPMRELPMGFGQIHTNDLSNWEGEPSHPGFQALVRAIEHKVGRKARLGALTHSVEAQAAAAELDAYKAAQFAATPQALEAFLKSFPRGAFAAFVRGQLELVAGQAKAASALAAPPAAAPRHPPDPSPAVPVEPPKPRSSASIFAVGGVLALLGVAGLWAVAAGENPQQEAIEAAAGLEGAWRAPGLDCDTPTNISVADKSLVISPSDGAPPQQIARLGEDGSIKADAVAGEYSYYLLGDDRLKVTGPVGNPYELTRCAPSSP
ncbi:MAG TPA: toll/interleukin-1 receptor domain-containing protein [Hyphomonadaceae bacterium]|nr:toll/interleukin-1 receptor domain-containing protein [Hyphomonadaceae bacterium]